MMPLVILLLVLLLALVIFTRRTSSADPVVDPKKLPSGSLLSKKPEEDCANKYGSDWSKFSMTSCKKN
jgi:hypothetical protein